MSKLIVEMEMPKNCPCELSAEVFDPFGNYGGHQPCFAWYGIPARSKEFDRCVVRSERPSWCPIKGVLPDEHVDLIDNEPTVDAVQVVRCKDCKYFIENTWECVRLSDRFGDEYSDARVYPEYYCADGERKDGERRTE